MSAESQPVAWYRSSPYQLFFPLGGLVSLLGVLPWALFALGVGSWWRPSLHAITEIQSALTFFAVGFAFTFVPRRTKTAPPTTAEVGVALALLFTTPVLSLAGFDTAAHLCWAILALFLFVFALTRIPKALKGGVAVSQLVWLPVSFGMAFAGALAASMAGPGRPAWLAPLGTSLVWQGMLGGLVVGIGGMLLPMLLHREPYRGDTTRASWALHVVASLTYAASFGLEWIVDLRLGYGLRAAVTFGMLLVAARLWRWPQAKGLHRRFAWVAAWMIPLGFALVAVFPAHRVGMLHLTFISGFGLLTFAVANHVTVAHGGRDPLLFANPKGLMVMGAGMALATVARVLVSADPSRLKLWVGLAFTFFVVALAGWAWWVLPKLKPERKVAACPQPPGSVALPQVASKVGS